MHVLAEYSEEKPVELLMPKNEQRISAADPAREVRLRELGQQQIGWWKR